MQSAMCDNNMITGEFLLLKQEVELAGVGLFLGTAAGVDGVLEKGTKVDEKEAEFSLKA